MRIIALILVLTAIVYGQSKSIEERLRSKNTEERMKAIEEVIEKKIAEAKPIIEEEIDKQELWLKPLYIEALKVLGSDKVEEKVSEYIRSIEQKAKENGEVISEELRLKIVNENKEQFERKDRGEQKK